MEESLASRLRKTAEEVAQRLNEAAQQAGERIGEIRETQRLTQRIRALTHEKQRCKLAMADLLLRMFDQETFAESLLRPEYQRIKAIDEEIARLEQEREQVGEDSEPAPEPPAATATDTTFPCEE